MASCREILNRCGWIEPLYFVFDECRISDFAAPDGDFRYSFGRRAEDCLEAARQSLGGGADGYAGYVHGGLGASADEATWVLTSYLVANAVILPASAYLTTFMGRKRFYMICVLLFGISSALCGLAPSLPLLIFFRILQGAGGGGLAPSEQAILADTFEPKDRGKAFAVYGMLWFARRRLGRHWAATSRITSTGAGSSLSTFLWLS
jgi:MFS family permease